MKENQTIIIAVVALILGFSGGYLLGGAGEGATPTNERGQFANLSPEERQARFAEFGNTRGGAGRVSRAGESVAAGEVISIDEQGITLKLRDGGSKIVFIGSATAVTKTASGTTSDIGVGTQVMILGKTNFDGSITAESVQIRPDGSMSGLQN